MSFAVVPCPHEATTSYGKGTRGGPQAILDALEQVEWFDEELLRIPVKKEDVRILNNIPADKIGQNIAKIISNNDTPVILGGEHSITPLAVKALVQKWENLSVLQLDAHADLRDSYQGRRDSHAAAMRRVHEICPLVQAGIRSISFEEWEWAQSVNQAAKIHFIRQADDLEKIVGQLSDHVYLTIDVDVFDPSVIPAAGTPEPGGFTWNQMLLLLKEVFKDKKVIGWDIVELSPRAGDLVSNFTAAKLLFKMLGMAVIAGK